MGRVGVDVADMGRTSYREDKPTDRQPPARLRKFYEMPLPKHRKKRRMK
jgi:hypothetical protein